MNNKKYIFILIFCLTAYMSAFAQYTGSNGKGDVVNLVSFSLMETNNALSAGGNGKGDVGGDYTGNLNGGLFTPHFAGGRGKGDTSIRYGLTFLNSIDLLSIGGVGKGDQFSNYSGNLSGMSFTEFTLGGIGAGDDIIEVKQTVLDENNLLCQGGNGNGDNLIETTSDLNGVLFLCHFAGGNGKGDTRILADAINLDIFAFLASGGLGKGDHLSDFEGMLNGTGFFPLYIGGNDNGDDEEIFDGDLNGNLYEPLFFGGIGKGDQLEEIVNSMLEFGNIMYAGGNGKGDDDKPYDGNLDGTVYLPLYAGGNDKGDNFILYDGSLNGDLFLPMYAGRNGKGDDDKPYDGNLDGTVYLPLYSGGNNKGDNYSFFDGTFDGTTILPLYLGGIDKGDVFALFEGQLNGSLFNPLYSGGIAKGDIVEEVVNAILSFTNTLFTGGDGKGDIQMPFEGALNGNNFQPLYTGGQAKGDNLIVFMNVPLGDYFTGAISTNFSLPGNWSNLQFPNGFTSHVISSTSQPVLNSLGFISTNTIVNIHSGSSLDITTTGILQVDGVINNSGTITIYSDATGTGAIGTSNGTINGSVTVQRYIPAVARRYRLYSPSITNYDYSQLIDDIFVTGPTNGIGFDATSHANNPSIYTYQEATTGGRGWKTFSNINTGLTIGNGALIFIRGDRTLPSPQWYTAPYVAQNAVTLDCTGNLHFGALTMNLTFNITGDANVDGFNLVGNPYASPIDWSLVTKNNLSPFYYVLNPITNAFEAYSSGNIASGQAFFVRATNTNPNITFNENNKSTTNTNGYFKTSILPMEFVLEMDSITKDKLYLNFDDNHSMNFNLNEDAIKLSNPSSLSIYTELNNSKLQINAVPDLDSWLVSDTIFVSTFASSGTYKINIQRLPSSTLGRQLWLQDKLTNVSFPLLTDTSFQIQITSANTSTYNRFALFMKNAIPVPVQWIKYSGLVKGEHAELKWSTANEKNNRGFFIERKLTSDSSFNSIRFVKGSGNSSTIQHYSFIDSGIFRSNNVCFYRLRQVNYDGTYSYSNTIKLEQLNLIDQELLAYPNPTKRNGILYIESMQEDDEFSVIILNSVGKEVLTVKSIKNKLELNTNMLSSGVYFIHYQSKIYHNKSTKKWVIY